jgi:CheY-like chemotaxis protein
MPDAVHSGEHPRSSGVEVAPEVGPETVHGGFRDDEQSQGIVESRSVGTARNLPSVPPWTKLLWVDDYINELDSYINTLTAAGFDVTKAASSAEALSYIDGNEFSVILVDIVMPPPDGIELVKELHKLGVHKNSAIGVLSSFLYVDLYRRRLTNLGVGVEIIDKDIPLVGDPLFVERFLDPVCDLVYHGVRYTVERQNEDLGNREDTNPFEIKLEEFLRKSILEKDQLVLKARQMASAVIEKEFQSGKVWVLMCGHADRIETSVNDVTEIPSDDDILRMALGQDRAPYQFFLPIGVDDLWSTCGPPQSPSNYPTVNLKIKNTDFVVHFDTGSPYTFFSYERLLEINAIQPPLSFTAAYRTGFDQGYFCARLDISVFVECQKTGATKAVRVRGQAVREWEKSPFVRHCPLEGECLLTGSITAFNSVSVCVHRVGLVGRNLLTENSLALVLDGNSSKTGLYHERPPMAGKPIS